MTFPTLFVVSEGEGITFTEFLLHQHQPQTLLVGLKSRTVTGQAPRLGIGSGTFHPDGDETDNGNAKLEIGRKGI